MTALVPSFFMNLLHSYRRQGQLSHKSLNEFEFCHCFKFELPAIEHHKLWSFQTLCWLPAERSLPIGLLVFHCLANVCYVWLLQ